MGVNLRQYHMFTTFPILTALLFAITACNKTKNDAGTTKEPSIAEQQVLEIAKRHLREETGEYGKEFIENSAKASDMGEEWHVTFQRVDGENQRPSTGIISVGKSTHKAKWVPQR